MSLGRGATRASAGGGPSAGGRGRVVTGLARQRADTRMGPMRGREAAGRFAALPRGFQGVRRVGRVPLRVAGRPVDSQGGLMPGQAQPGLDRRAVTGVAHPPPEHPHRRSPKKGRDSSHQAAAPCDDCGNRLIVARGYLSMYARTTGFSSAGSTSSTGGPLIPTNGASKRRAERNWETRMVRIGLVFSCGSRPSRAFDTAGHPPAGSFVALAGCAGRPAPRPGARRRGDGREVRPTARPPSAAAARASPRASSPRCWAAGPSAGGLPR
jgi:hypothetical protein